MLFHLVSRLYGAPQSSSQPTGDPKQKGASGEPLGLGGAGDRVADVADQSVDQGLVVRFTHHPDDRLGA